MNLSSNKLQFKKITKECKDIFLTLLVENNIDIASKKITPIFKVFFQGTMYFNSINDYLKAVKLLKTAKEIEQQNFKNWLKEERLKLS